MVIAIDNKAGNGIELSASYYASRSSHLTSGGGGDWKTTNDDHMRRVVVLYVLLTPQIVDRPELFIC